MGWAEHPSANLEGLMLLPASKMTRGVPAGAGPRNQGPAMAADPRLPSTPQACSRALQASPRLPMPAGRDRTEGAPPPPPPPGAAQLWHAARPVPPLGAGFPPARPLKPAGPRARGTRRPTEGQGGGPWAAGRSSEGSNCAEAPFPAPRHGPGWRSELEFRGV